MILAFTGAGISKASGISTFMEQPDVRNKLHRTYAQKYPETYRKTITKLKETVDLAKPNDAHQALFDYNVTIISMNIDGLHEMVGSDIVALHGTLPSHEELTYCDTLFNKPVLYGDPAPMYQKAFELVSSLGVEDVFLVIGASHHTAIAQDLRDIAKYKGARMIEIQQNAHVETRKTLNLLHQPAD